MGESHRVLGHTWERPPQRLPLILNATEHWRPRGGVSGRISHACWVLDYTYSPGGTYRAGSNRRPWRDRPSQAAHLYPPLFPYWEDISRVARTVHSSYVNFLGGEAVGLDELVAGRAGFCVFSDTEGILGSILHRCADVAASRAEDGFLAAESSLLEALSVLLHSERTGDGSRRVASGPVAPTRSRLVSAVHEYLERRLAERVTLDELARRAHVSASKLSHNYKEETGETPMQTHARLRIRTAKALLMKGHALAYIADLTGFCDAYHLSKTFKRVTGTAPRDFVRASTHRGAARG